MAPQFAGIAQYVPMIILAILFYFLLIRPQQKQAKAHQQMVNSLTKGDEVLTQGGLVGRVANMITEKDEFISLEVAKGIVIYIQPSACIKKLEKGTFKIQ
ncbi:MAG: preprotein translocase subunit YajC [Neisseriaceae bacterium]|nr:preprotein translocase subunit YajC [Neisseriaceae bacterium]